MADEKMLRRVLDLARADVHKGQAPLALSRLREILPEIDDLERRPLWAEYLLTYAGALAGMDDQGAESAFKEALSRIRSVPELDPELVFRAHEEFGRHYAGRCLNSAALEQYKLAEAIALEHGLPEEAARAYLCIVRIDLETNHDPRLESLRNLKKAARGLYTAREQQAAWIQYCQELEDSGRTLLAARNFSAASVEYFRGVLSTLRRSSNEAAD